MLTFYVSKLLAISWLETCQLLHCIMQGNGKQRVNHVRYVETNIPHIVQPLFTNKFLHLIWYNETWNKAYQNLYFMVI